MSTGSPGQPRVLSVQLLGVVVIAALTALCIPEVTAAWQPSSIHLAAQTGDAAKIKDLVRDDPGLLNAADDQGSAPLHTAAAAGQKHIVELLLSLGADVNVKNRDGSTPLHVAASEARGEIVDLLLAKGADLFALDANGMTVLHSAAYGGATPIARKLIELGLDVNTKKTNGSAPLHGAALGGFIETVEMLLSEGADPNLANVNGFTPLLTATSAGQTAVAEALVAHGADVFAKLPNGQTAMHYAAWTGKTDIVRLLLSKGMSPNFPDGGEAGPMIGAIFGGHTETVRALLEAGADVHQKSQDGRTALFASASGQGSLEIARMLIDKGAAVELADLNGVTPLGLAVQNNLAEMAEVFLKNGADVNRPIGPFGWTSLHSAAVRGDNKMVVLLLDNGADADAVDSDGNTPLDLAANHGNDDVAETLVSRGGKASKTEQDLGRSDLLSKRLKPGEAVLWHLGHCGWAVKTQNHLLIFDYWNRGAEPAHPCLANGHIDPAEIAGQNTIVFVSHEHTDHFDSTIFTWRRPIKDITYVYGFKPEELPQYSQASYAGPAYEYVGPRDTKRVGDLEIATIAANDAGVGFLVRVDGLTLFHAGDHAGWADGEKQGYLDEIDYLAGLTDGVDLAFLNVTGCHAHNPDALKEGLLYALGRVPPKALVPTHGLDRESVYADAAAQAAGKGMTFPVACPKARGDRFIYSNGTLEKSLE